MNSFQMDKDSARFTNAGTRCWGPGTYLLSLQLSDVLLWMFLYKTLLYELQCIKTITFQNVGSLNFMGAMFDRTV